MPGLVATPVERLTPGRPVTVVGEPRIMMFCANSICVPSAVAKARLAPGAMSCAICNMPRPSSVGTPMEKSETFCTPAVGRSPLI